MAFPPGPWCRCILNFGNAEKEWQNEVWYKLTGSISPTLNISTVASDVEAALKPSFVAFMSSLADWMGVDVYLNNGTYTVAGHTYTIAAGTGTSAALPSEDAAIVTLNAGIGTRKGVGRTFVGGLDGGNVVESKLTSSGLTKLAAIATALKGLGTFDSASGYLAVWSRTGTSSLDGVSFTESRQLLGHRTHRRPRR